MIFCISVNADKPCGPGTLDYVVFVGYVENGMDLGLVIIKLNVFKTPNYTKRLYLQRYIYNAFLNNSKVILYTNSCQTEDYGFAKFEVLAKNDDGD